jgi:hypothetical protein
MKVDREWLRKNVEVELKVEDEVDIDWRKDFEDSPDAVKWVEDQLAAKNPWAWCMVTIIVTFRQFVEKDYIGGCSYESEEDFKKGGYYEAMVTVAVAEIADYIEDLALEHALWEHEKRSCIECLAE